MNAALAVKGNYAYVGNRTDGTHVNPRVLVVDVSNPARARASCASGRNTCCWC
jgi:hypothetical protein